ncbi:MAG: four helix bundle protein [Ignavibacteria bacterium]
MGEIRSHRDLDVWKKSVDLVTDIYEITKYFPKEEIYSLTNQIRRSAISIPSNIAEGASRNHTKEFVQFLYISLGSCSELETQLIISFKINYLSKEKLDLFLDKLFDLRRMILGLIRAVTRDGRAVTKEM